MGDTNTDATAERRERRFDRDRPRTPHTTHLREFQLPDGRRLLVDRRLVGFLCESKPGEFGDKVCTVMAFRTQARACPVVAAYDDVRSWWWGTNAPASNGKASP
jgi:hypothetical protein